MIENLIVHFSVLYEIHLTELNINENISIEKNRNKYQIDENKNIVSLNLIDNQLLEIPPILDEYPSLKLLILAENKIKKITGLFKLKKLESLDLSNNEIQEIENINNLLNLKTLNLSFNQIRSIKTIQNSNLEELNLSQNKIEEIEGLKNLYILQNLNLSNNYISEIKNLEELLNLVKVNISNNNIKEIKNLENLTFLEDLDLSENNISEIRNLNNKNLNSLNLYLNGIIYIENLKNLSALEFLDLSYNSIFEIENLETLLNLYHLDLSGNAILEVKNLNSLINLTYLNLSNNNIFKIINLSIQKLTDLNLSSNKINNYNEIFEILNYNNLEYFIVDDNPFLIDLDIKLEEYENHLDTLKNELEKLSKNQIIIQLPVKIMLLGNHSSGKSTFLDYYIKNKVINKNDSTHILRISTIPKITSKSKNLPKVIFYDFGGQDYYHGVYQAFLSLDTINLVFWHNNKEKYKKNGFAIDIDFDNKDNEIINFPKEYWLNQISYANKQKRKSYIDKTNETNYLIQTHADVTSQEFNISGEFNQLFYISLNSKRSSKKNELALQYLKESINEEIENRYQPVKKTDNEINLYNYILKSLSEDWVSIKNLINIYGSTEESLKAELEQLAMKGMVLYYKNIDTLEDCVWLNPSKTVQKIHGILIKESNGEINKKDFEEKIKDDKIIEMLKANKVIFLDSQKNNERYIIPGYLEFANENNDDYFFFTEFESANFVLKFLHFIPFGLINQLICHFGQNPDKKKFWRDQLIFTFKKFRVRIKLNFKTFEIRVFINGEKNNIQEIEREIFLDIMHMYWDIKIPKINNFRLYKKLVNELQEKVNDNKEVLRLKEEVLNDRIEDLYISIDGKRFIHHMLLQKLDKSLMTIPSYMFDGNKLYNSGNVSTLDYKNFTNNINIKAMKKIFISYSRKDVDYKDELKKHLNILNTFSIADNWSCEEITIGKWDDQIQKELNESDLIIYMLSANFFGSKYILNDEVKRGMDLIDQNPSKKILCVIVSEFVALDRLKTTKEDRNDLQQSILKLSEYQYLPYGRIKNPVTKKFEEKIIPLTSYSDHGDIDSAFTEITKKVLDILK